MMQMPLPIPDESSPTYQIFMAISKAKDAIRRAEDNIADWHLQPSTCAYIDGQLSRAVGYLASARAVAVTEGGLSAPAFDPGDDDVDLDEVWEPTPEAFNFHDGGAT